MNRSAMVNILNNKRTRTAATLIELMLSMAAASILLAGMASAVYLANQAATPGNTPAAAIQGSLLASDIAEELKYATRILTAEESTIQFQRTRNNTAEQIAYAWSGVAGDPLTRSLDSGDPVAIADHVQDFQLTYVPSPGPLANMLENPGAEDGTNYWSGNQCDIESTDASFHGGSRSLRAYNRSANTSGPRQFVTLKIDRDTSYQIEAWLRVATGTQTPRISLHLMTTGGLLSPLTVDAPAISTGWSKVSVNLTTPTWAGELRWAYLKISTVADAPLPDLYCDDLTMSETGTGTPVALDRIGIELQLEPNTRTRSAVTARLLQRPILWQP